MSAQAYLFRTANTVAPDVTEVHSINNEYIRIGLTRVILQVDLLEQEAFEALRLVRSWKNRLSPINRIPPEVLALIPDSWYLVRGNKDVIALTHVCQFWREIFTSRASLWTKFFCVDKDQTRVYLERSKSSLIGLFPDKADTLSPHDPLFQVIPHAVGRLEYVNIEGAPANIPEITAHLCHPAPFLTSLVIDGGCEFEPEDNSTLPTELFNGDLSSLSALCLSSIHTELPWRNMVNLTSFMFCHADVPIAKLLDFFEGAPHLRKIQFHSVFMAPEVQNRPLVSLASLQGLLIFLSGPSSPLLDYLLIPVGASLVTRPPFHGSMIDNVLPSSLGNLRNLPGFTKIKLHVSKFRLEMRFIGPNGRVSVNPMSAPDDCTLLVLESLARFDTSMTERLKIFNTNPSTTVSTLQALLPMENLRSLVLIQCNNPYPFIDALRYKYRSSDVVVCPKLEELTLVLRPDEDRDFRIGSVILMVEIRALAGTKLNCLRIGNWDDLTPIEEWKLKKHVLHLEVVPGVHPPEEDSDGSDWEDD